MRRPISRSGRDKKRRSEHEELIIYHDVKLRGISFQMIFWKHGGRWIWGGLRFMFVW